MTTSQSLSLTPEQLDLLQAFERGLDPQHPERSAVPAQVLGYGEISTVLAIQAEELRGLAVKRLPLFHDAAEVEKYCAAYVEYNRLLVQAVGINLPPYGYAVCSAVDGRPVFYILQKQLAAGSLAHRALHTFTRDQVLALVRQVLGELRKVWAFNRRQTHLQLAVDAQISNWALASAENEKDALLYVDTSTPLFRVQGVEQLDTELFLRSAPSFLVWVLRLFFLKDVVNRYYDPHQVTVDLVANFYKEHQAELIPDVIGVVNEFFMGPAAEFGIPPISEQEVRDYYREDAFIWSLYFSMRKLDRFLRTWLLHRTYPYILPARIER